MCCLLRLCEIHGLHLGDFCVLLAPESKGVDKTGIIADNDVFRFLPDGSDQKAEITDKLHIERLFAHIHFVKLQLCLDFTENIQADFACVFGIKQVDGILRAQLADSFQTFFMYVFKIYEKYFLRYRLRLYRKFQYDVLQIDKFRAL